VRCGLEHDPLVPAEREVDAGQAVEVPERRHRSRLAVGEGRGDLRLGRQPDITPPTSATLSTP
jgi:hypothetical protein